MKFNWITAGTKTPFYARKKFTVKGEIKHARIRICGLGQFELHVNGEKIGDHELDPAWTDYRKLVQYVTFDLTDRLTEGENVVGAEVGNGWFLMDTNGGYSFQFPGFMPPNPNPYEPFGDSLVLGAILTITYEDGAVTQLQTDASWKTAKHEVMVSNIYGSEIIDRRQGQKGWDRVEFDDSVWQSARDAAEKEIPRGELLEQTMPPVKVIEQYTAKYCGTVETQAEEKTVRAEIYDLGQNCSFLLAFDVKGQAGDTVKFYPAEKRDASGDVDQMAKGWMMVDNCVTYVIGSENWESYRQKFSYSAGRYIRVVRFNPGIEIRNLCGHAISSAWKKDGQFHCDDERYEQIYNLVEKSVEANMVSVHTDCPTIERFAWQEPNHLMAPSIFYMKDGKELWSKFLQDMRASQHTKEDRFRDYEGNAICPGDGLMPSQCPCYIPNVIPVPGMGSFYDIIPWGSTCILGTRWHYIFYGDQKIIEDNYEAGKRYFAHLMTRLTEDGFINHGLGDWGNPENELARENVETVFLYADAVTLRWFAEILGRQEDETYFDQTAGSIKTNYNDRLLVQDENGKWCYRNYEHQETIVTTQACEALPLYWGMVPEEYEKDVVEAFRDSLSAKGSFMAGEIGLPYVIQTASKYGMNDLVAEFITKPEHPSYYAFVLEGLTTLGEYWEENPRSQCHDMMGHIIEWYYNGMAGIKPLAPGFRKVIVKPYLPRSINRMDVEYNSASGEIHVSMRRENQSVVLEVQADPGIEFAVDRTQLN